MKTNKEHLLKRIACAVLALVTAGCCASCNLDTVHKEVRQFFGEFSAGPSADTSSEPASSWPVPAESSAPTSSVPESAVPVESVQTEYYFQHLSAAQQKDYGALLAAVSAQEETAVTQSNQSGEVFPVMRALYYDHPELFWLPNGGGEFYSYTNRGEYHFTYLHTAGSLSAMQAELEAAAAGLLETVPENATEYQRVQMVFEYLVDHIEYDLETENSGNIYGALVEGRARCEGYARAAQYLLNRLGVFCTYVAGECYSSGSHAWNLIQVDGSYYYMDVTWGDPSFLGEGPGIEQYRNYSYLCATTQEILATRTIDETYAPMPVCDATQYNYFRQNGLFVDQSLDQAKTALQQQYQAGKCWIPLQFASVTLYEQARKELIEGQGLYTVMDAAGASLTGYSYLQNEQLRTLTFIFS